MADIGDFTQRLFAGPDDVVLSDHDLALLEAYLGQPVSFAKMQREAQSFGESESQKRKKKLKSIRDFNRILRKLQESAKPERSPSILQGDDAGGNADSTGAFGNTATATPADESPKITDSMRRAYDQWKLADETIGSCTDDLAYDWTEARLAKQAESMGPAAKGLPVRETWKTYVSKARSAEGTPKNLPRYGRTGRSVAKQSDL